MDPYSGPYINPFSSLHNPFPHSLLRTRQGTIDTLRPLIDRTLIGPFKGTLKGTLFPTKNQTEDLCKKCVDAGAHMIAIKDTGLWSTIL